MAGYNNGFGGNQGNNGWNSGNNGYNNYGSMNANQMNNGNGVYGLTPQQIVQYFQQGRLEWSDFVHGRAGAEAYQLPPGVNVAKLWDDENNRFYVKGYDNNGRPRVLEDSDFQAHIEPEPQSYPQIDLSNYATKDDIKSMISDAFCGLDIRPNMAGYVTQDELNKILGSLAVGNGGRIVRYDESNA